MKLLVTRVSRASVSVDGKITASIEKGLAVFAGIEKTDNLKVFDELATRLINLRIFEDAEGKLNYSLKDKGLPVLCISNFTLCASTDKGRRPSFEGAMPRLEAQKPFDDFCSLLEAREVTVKKGVFGEHMDINLTMDGPVNIMLENHN